MSTSIASPSVDSMDVRTAANVTLPLSPSPPAVAASPPPMKQQTSQPQQQQQQKKSEKGRGEKKKQAQKQQPPQQQDVNLISTSTDSTATTATSTPATSAHTSSVSSPSTGPMTIAAKVGGKKKVDDKKTSEKWKKGDKLAEITPTATKKTMTSNGGATPSVTSKSSVAPTNESAVVSPAKSTPDQPPAEPVSFSMHDNRGREERRSHRIIPKASVTDADQDTKWKHDRFEAKEKDKERQVAVNEKYNGKQQQRQAKGPSKRNGVAPTTPPVADAAPTVPSKPLRHPISASRVGLVSSSSQPQQQHIVPKSSHDVVDAKPNALPTEKAEGSVPLVKPRPRRAPINAVINATFNEPTAVAAAPTQAPLETTSVASTTEKAVSSEPKPKRGPIRGLRPGAKEYNPEEFGLSPLVKPAAALEVEPEAQSDESEVDAATAAAASAMHLPLAQMTSSLRDSELAALLTPQHPYAPNYPPQQQQQPLPPLQPQQYQHPSNFHHAPSPQPQFASQEYPSSPMMQHQQQQQQQPYQFLSQQNGASAFPLPFLPLQPSPPPSFAPVHQMRQQATYQQQAPPPPMSMHQSQSMPIFSPNNIYTPSSAYQPPQPPPQSHQSTMNEQQLAQRANHQRVLAMQRGQQMQPGVFSAASFRPSIEFPAHSPVASMGYQQPYTTNQRIQPPPPSQHHHQVQQQQQHPVQFQQQPQQPSYSDLSGMSTFDTSGATELQRSTIDLIQRLSREISSQQASAATSQQQGQNNTTPASSSYMQQLMAQQQQQYQQDHQHSMQQHQQQRHR